MVTNLNWEHFWLNEGFTVYIERRILAHLKSEQEAEFQAMLGYNHLLHDIEVQNPAFTKMIPSLDKTDPDDAFSSVPYEKVGNKSHFNTNI